MVGTVNEEDEGETEKYRRYPSRQIHQIPGYGPTFQGKLYKYVTMLLNFEYKMGSTMTEADDIKQIIGIIIYQKYSLKVGLKSFG